MTNFDLDLDNLTQEELGAIIQAVASEIDKRNVLNGAVDSAIELADRYESAGGNAEDLVAAIRNRPSSKED